MKRRKFIGLAGTGLVVAGGLTYFLNEEYQNKSYRERATDIRKYSNYKNSGKLAMLELVRYATLAANSHNTQPWLFKVETNKIIISPDFSRRCSAVDPDNHHLYASLGCASENIIHAAGAFGLKANISVNGDSDKEIQLDFEPASSIKSDLFQAIPKRQCTRGIYEGKKVSTKELNILESIAQDDGISTKLLTNETHLETILEYVVEGNSAQMKDEAFMKELKDWLRFNSSSVMKHGDGLYAASSGNPNLPSWLGNIMFDIVFKEKTENEKYRDHIRSSAGVIAFISEENNIESWIKSGRSYQRFALQATALGLKHAFINQAVEVPKVRKQLAQYLNIGARRTDLLIRFGYGTELPKSLRRPINDVII